MSKLTDRQKAHELAFNKTLKSLVVYKTRINYWHCPICLVVYKQWWADEWFDKLPEKYWYTTLCRKCYKKLIREVAL